MVTDKYHLVELNGTISAELYEIVSTDKRGGVLLKQVGADKTLKVSAKRLLPQATAGKAVVIMTDNRPYAVCPSCLTPILVNPNMDFLRCCNNELELYWMKGKPMTTTTEKPAKAPRVATPRVKKQPTGVDLGEVRKVGELWVKKGLQFSDAKADVCAFALLIEDGENSRKLCFNTYNGNLGRKAKELPLAAFAQNKVPDGEKSPWFKVDVAKERAKLAKSDYVKDE